MEEPKCNICKDLKYVCMLDVNDAPRASTVCRCHKCNVPREDSETGKTEYKPILGLSTDRYAK